MKNKIEEHLKKLDNIIEADTEELNSDEKKFEERIDFNNKLIKRIRFLVWILVILGAIIMLHGIIETSDKRVPLKLNELGDYLGGTVASLWSLAGVLFIYISFLSQQIELGYTRLEQKRSRLQLLHNQREMARQRVLADVQIKALKHETILKELDLILVGISDEINRIDYFGIKGEQGLENHHNLILVGLKEGKDFYEQLENTPALFSAIQKGVALLYFIDSNRPHAGKLINIIQTKLTDNFMALILMDIIYGSGIGDNLKDFSKSHLVFDYLYSKNLLPEGALEEFLDYKSNS